MTVIRPNSISGINSITGSGGDISIFRADGTPADVTVNNITSGVITATHYGSGANLTNLPSGQLTGTIADARLSTVSSSKLSGALPALDGSALTGVGIGTDGAVNTSGIITATAFVPTTGQLSHRNLIINGDFRIAQRGYENSYSSTANGIKTVDRFAMQGSGADENPTQSQHTLTSSDTGPYEEGFRKSWHIQNGNQTGGAGSSDYVQPETRLEAQDLANCGWNYTSSSSFITLSFWVKSSVAGDYTCNLSTHDGTGYRYLMEYTLAANTWKKITKTIPGNSNLTFNNDNGHGLTIMWYPFLGSGFIQADQENNWYASSNGKYGTVSTTSWWTTNDATWEITGVQLEVGPVATPFEHLPYAEQFRQCARYCYQWIDDQMLGFGQVYSGSGYVKIFPPVPVNMRAKPSVTKNAPTGYWFVSYQGNSGYAGDRAVTIEGNSGSEIGHSANVFRLFVNGGSNQGNGTTVWCLIHDTAGAYLRLEAEL